MQKLNDKIKHLPNAPGVYLFRASNGSVLYAGKAGSLRKRVRSYFTKALKDPRVSAMISQAADIDYIQLKSESEALLLEDKLVKEYQPKYNIELKDDKRYPLVRLTLDEPWPRLQLVRIRKENKGRYFGPYTDVKALRRVSAFLRKTFKLKSCKSKMPDAKDVKHCLYYHLGECLAPCIRKVSPTKYQEAVKEVIMFLEGRTDELTKKLRSKMLFLSRHKNYEEAAKIRNIIFDLEEIAGTKVRKEILKGMVYSPAEINKEIAALKEVLKLKEHPVWIDAFDVSNLYGKDAVGSLIVFRNGIPYKNKYRRFMIKTVTGIDDYAMIKEIMTRRYKRLIKEKGEMPNLILIDGGKGQYTTAVNVLTELGLGDIKAIGLAKRFEEIYTPDLIKLSKDSPVLKLLMRVRDEAHRFAIAYHRVLRKRILKNDK